MQWTLDVTDSHFIDLGFHRTNFWAGVFFFYKSATRWWTQKVQQTLAKFEKNLNLSSVRLHEICWCCFSKR